jgi:signal transduction histidine kinase
MEMTSKLSGLEISVTTVGICDFSDIDLKDDLLCVMQECLTNIMKHSTARVADINILRNSRGLEIKIEDRGKQHMEEVREGNGLAGIRARVARYDGDVHFSSADGRGFSVALRIPAEALL